MFLFLIIATLAFGSGDEAFSISSDIGQNETVSAFKCFDRVLKTMVRYQFIRSIILTSLSFLVGAVCKNSARLLQWQVFSTPKVNHP